MKKLVIEEINKEFNKIYCCTICYQSKTHKYYEFNNVCLKT